MFDDNLCQATDTCRNWPGWHVWCFKFAGEKFDQPTWVQVCGFHLTKVSSQVAMVQHPKPRSLVS